MLLSGPAETPPYSTEPKADGVLCILLSFNGCDDTLACIESISSQTSRGFDLIVIDNASEPGVTKRLQEKYPRVELISLEDNRGWAGGNNAGIKIAMERGYKWVCLLNNDTVFPPGEVSKWRNAILNAPPCLLHPTIYYWDEPETPQLNQNGELQDAKNMAFKNWHGKVAMDRAYGACLAIPREIFERIGLFDERFFLQLEETDMHLRASGAGYVAACDPSVKIFHKESRAFGGTKAPIKTYYTVRNTLLLIEKGLPKGRSRAKGLKELYWTISHVAAAALGVREVGAASVATWLISQAPAAISIRLAIGDYLFRKFGKISPFGHQKIKAAETLQILINSEQALGRS